MAGGEVGSRRPNEKEDSAPRPLFYRYTDFMDGRGKVKLEEELFFSIRATPSGHWVAPVYYQGQAEEDIHEKRWVSSGAAKRHCYPTRAQAWDSYLRRKQRQVKILKSQLARAEYALQQAKAVCPDGAVDETTADRFNDFYGAAGGLTMPDSGSGLIRLAGKGPVFE